ncbi:hypothetical protein NB311A_09836 [Nitrobacter sp. Nb-311A]|jgi:hypothetical protein|uniref:hypothetical protein n=1 Tax=Nitrobacter sp. Nb-311A TaxID=314253 RepID=UPI00006854DE|nr:hypothetical protein [Nitrobacter sp. Nb-311A]EAQ33473.1 hypothetical protein NB311A_09836 [Nitrobacter sp. Nb-311A]
MKSPLAALLPELQRATQDGREQVAREHLAPARIRELVHEAALKGHCELRVALPNGIEVRDTDACEDFLTWVKREGLEVEWQSRTCITDDGRSVPMVEPVISW